MKYTLAEIHKVSYQLHRRSVEAEVAFYEARLVELQVELKELDEPEREAMQRLRDADPMTRSIVLCKVRWIGSVWHCLTHDRYIEDGDVCPDVEPQEVAE